MSVIIMRGLPGAGKSHLARKIHAAAAIKDGKTAQIVSADDHFTDVVTGEYKYEPALIGEAHARCFEKAHNFISTHHQHSSVLIVDNSNIHAWEFQPYVMMGRLFGHEVSSRLVWCTIEQSIRRNIHNVPPAVILRMHKNLEPPTPGLVETLVMNDDPTIGIFAQQEAQVSTK